MVLSPFLLLLALPACSSLELVLPSTETRGHAVEVSESGVLMIAVEAPTSPQAAVVAGVLSGSWSNPPYLLGLAHLVEHTVFQGSCVATGPFDVGLAERGGSSNAYTASDRTVYYASGPATPSFLSWTANQMSGFFKCPKLAPSSIAAEVAAVTSEHGKNTQDDGWRLQRAVQLASSRGTDVPAGRFATGNRETLANVTDPSAEIPASTLDNLAASMHAFVDLHYRPTNLVVAAVSTNPAADTLAALRTTFGTMNASSPTLPPLPRFQTPRDDRFAPEDLGSLRLRLLPVSETRRLVLLFPLPALQPLVLTAPVAYANTLLGREGPGSLSAALRRRALATSLSVGTYEQVDQVATYALTIDLTSDGLQQLDDVLTTVWSALATLVQGGGAVDEGVWQEVASVRAASFHHRPERDATGYAASLVSAALNARRPGTPYDDSRLLIDAAVPSVFDAAALRSVLDCLRPTKSVQLLLAPLSHPGADSDSFHTEHYYGLRYRRELLDPDTVAAWSALPGNATATFTLPTPNPDLPRSFDIVPTPPPPLTPFVYSQLMGVTAVHSFGAKEQSSSVAVRLALSSPLLEGSAAGAAVWLVLREVAVQHTAAGVLSQAAVAGLDVRMNVEGGRLVVTLEGEADTAPLVLRDLLSALARSPGWAATAFADTPALFRALQTTVQEDALNSLHAMPILVALAARFETLYVGGGSFRPTDVAVAAAGLTSTSFLSAASASLHSTGLHLTWASVGNWDEDAVVSAVRGVHAALTADRGTLPPLPLLGPTPMRVVRLPRRSPATYVLAGQPGEKNTALVRYLQVGALSGAEGRRTSALLSALGPLISQTTFATLRTERHLGYVAQTSVNKAMRVGWIRFLLQSDVLDARGAVDVLDTFMEEELVWALRNLTDAQLTQAVGAAVKDALEEPSTLSGQLDRMWGAVEDGTGEYKYDYADLVPFLRNLTLTDVQWFVTEFLVPSTSPQYRALDVIVYPQPANATTPAATVLTKGEFVHEIANAEAAKRTLALFPVPYATGPGSPWHPLGPQDPQLCDDEACPTGPLAGSSSPAHRPPTATESETAFVVLCSLVLLGLGLTICYARQLRERAGRAASSAYVRLEPVDS
jgi:insulysin